MFRRPLHNKIAKLLEVFDCDALSSSDCYFGDGTAIVLCLDEYRESVDVDFLCASVEGYRVLRNITTSDSLGGLLRKPVKHVRDVRADRYGIRTIVEIDGSPIKVEIVSEGRIPISGQYDATLKVPLLSRVDMFAEKLLATADRGLDRGARSRDLVDIAAMIEHWGEIPKASVMSPGPEGPGFFSGASRSWANAENFAVLSLAWA